MMNMWQMYRQIFPKRYLEGSESDVFMKAELDKLPSGTALDVGGGVDGTSYLLEWANAYWLLDPYVDSSLTPCDYEDLEDEENPQIFDVVLARGSINYLKEEEIVNVALAAKRLFIFNTFKTPTVQERNYETLQGHKGKEKSVFVKEIGSFGGIEHTLKPASGVEIVHSFYYYPPDFFEGLLNLFMDLEMHEFGKNSVVFVGKPKKS